MEIYKTSEKLTVWMKRHGFTQQYISDELAMTRQTLITRIKNNDFKTDELNILNKLGFEP